MVLKQRVRFLTLAAIFAGFLALSDMRGQASLGTVSGVVKDETGAVLPGVTIKAQHLETAIARTAVTDDSGRYHLQQLALGEHELQAELVGFQTAVQRGIKLTVGQQLEVNFVLRVGEITEKVEVSGEAPLVETTTSTISGLIDDRQIRDLPLNGRSVDQLAL
ncbi:MAG: carboxypeptidase regulatory-like domain-containing protein, partial [Acidobacteria bacterium]|nr:carboxypeptidase regulatory-like domain-containing protein [Acidobacteriota bacterium]